MKQSVEGSIYLNDTFFADEEDNESSSWGIFCRSVGGEENYRVHRVKHHSSPVFKIIFFLVTLFMLSYYWISIINQKKTIASLALCISSVFLFVLSHGCVAYVENSRSPEALVQRISSKLIFVFMIASLLYSFLSIFYIQISWELCIPILHATSTHSCHHYFPQEILTYFLFLPIIYLMTHPNLCWQVTVTFYVTCVVVAITCLAFAPRQDIPIVLLSIVLSFLCTFMVQVEVKKAFILYHRVQKQSNLRSEAKMAVQLRRMIGGVSHDLKSPLSALSLGLENWKNKLNDFYEQFHQMTIPTGWENNFATIMSCMQKNGQMLHMLRQVNSSMDKIIGRCIDANRVISGLPLLPTMSYVSVYMIVQKILDMFQQEHKHLRFQLVYEDNSKHKVSQDVTYLNLYTDRTWLEENLSCLLGNAVKFGDYTCCEQQENIITLEICRADNIIRFTVIDHGEGVKESTKATLFTFLGHDEQDSVGGSGLGLFTLACRVTALRGRYGYNPVKHENAGERKAIGSKFWFELMNNEHEKEREVFVKDTLPVYFGDLEEGLSRIATNDTGDHHLMDITGINDGTLKNDDKIWDSFSSLDKNIDTEYTNNNATMVTTTHNNGVVLNRTLSCSSSSFSPAERPLRILLVDDSLPIRKMCSTVLKAHNHTVVTMANGKDAVHYFKSLYLHPRMEEQKAEVPTELKQEIDVILMDLQMPIMDGIVATRCIRNLSTVGIKAQVPIIGMSACSDAEIIRVAMATGMNDFLAKPFTMEQFQRCVAALNVV